MLDAALGLADKGLAVFPIKAGTKNRPLIKAWQKNASNDLDQVRSWWKQWPDANIGICCGLSGLVVVDIDLPDGPAAWDALCKERGIRTDTVTVETPSGGWHLWYRAPPGSQLRNTARRLGPGLDTRAGAGYVIAPPSGNGHGTYSWGPSSQIVPLPNALRDLLLQPRHSPPAPSHSSNGQHDHSAYVQAALEAEIDAVQHAKNGQRNDQLNRSAYALGQLVASTWAGLDRLTVERGLTNAALATGLDQDPGCGLAGIAKTLQSGLESGVASPRPEPENRRTPAAAYEEHGSQQPAQEPAEDGRPTIDAGIQDLDRATNEAWAILETANDPPLLFVHGGQLTRLELGEPAPMLATIDVDRLRYEASRVARWFTRRKVDGLWEDVDARPPVVVMRNMLARPTGELRLPPVDRIVRSPVFAADGTLQRAPGYHAGGRVIVCMDPELVIPEIPQRPTDDQVRGAVKTIDDLLRDFPFTAAADRAHAFALLLGPLVRDMIAGPTPLHLVESATPGSGKGLLVSVLLTASLGDDVATMSAGRDDEEWRKRLTTILRAGQPAVVIDNVRESIDAAPLSSALTASWWDDRILGANELLHLPVRCVWAATGNNPMLSTEIARRTVRIRVDPKMDQPWRREASTFTHPELLTYAQQRRGVVLAAGLTLAQAWIAAGQPRAKTPPLGSYEPWVRVIGGILAHAKIDGFLANLDELYERADSEGAVWRRFVQAWWEDRKSELVGVAELYPLALELDDFPLGNGKERSQKIRLGKGLRQKQDVVLAGYRIESAGTYQRTARYRLHRTYTNVGVCGVSGVSPSPTGETIVSDHGLSENIHDIHHIHQKNPEEGPGAHQAHQEPDMAAECCVCGAPVDHYGPSGEAWCTEHWPAELAAGLAIGTAWLETI